LVDCDDWDCQYDPDCESSGVNEAGYVDTSMPRITGIKVEEYPDAALVMYDTNKPSNGTLIFWHNDSSCSNTIMNRTIYDIGINSSTVREKKSWHYGKIFNDSGVDSLDYELMNDTDYYYKLKVCDSGGKCSQSACSPLRTAESLTKCGYCNFVTLLDVPTGWNVTYDLDIDGTYEHNQYYECGPNAGMKTNYTTGRRANIRVNKNDGSVYFEFMNVSLTKTGLTSDTRSISNATSLIHDTSEGHVGMPAETRDKIINNLHPEVCRMKIPATGECNALYHCDDDGDNCRDRTDDAGGAPIDATNCVWQLPYCEFSTWDEDGNPAADDPQSPGTGGGGGGGGGAVVNTTTTDDDDTEETTTTTPSKDKEADVAADAAPVDEPQLSPEVPKERKILGTILMILRAVVLVIAAIVVVIFVKRR